MKVHILKTDIFLRNNQCKEIRVMRPLTLCSKALPWKRIIPWLVVGVFLACCWVADCCLFVFVFFCLMVDWLSNKVIRSVVN